MVLSVPQNRYWHTVFLPGRQVGFKIDIDCRVGEDFDEPAKIDCAIRMFDNLFDEIKQQLEYMDITDYVLAETDFLVCSDYSLPGKISMHVHCDKLVFHSIEHLSAFIDRIKRSSAIIVELENGIDSMPFGINRSLKLPLQRKSENRQPMVVDRNMGMGGSMGVSEEQAVTIGMAHKPDSFFPADRIGIKYEDIPDGTPESASESVVKRSIIEASGFDVSQEGAINVTKCKNIPGKFWVVFERNRARRCVVVMDKQHTGSNDGKQGLGTTVDVANDRFFKVTCQLCEESVLIPIVDEEGELKQEAVDGVEAPGDINDGMLTPGLGALFEKLQRTSKRLVLGEPECEVGDELPAIPIRDRMHQLFDIKEEATIYFNEYWSKAMAALKPKRAKKKARTEEPPVNRKEMLVRYREAHDQFYNLVTDYLNDYCCEITEQRFVAVYDAILRKWCFQPPQNWVKDCDKAYSLNFPDIDPQGLHCVKRRSFYSAWMNAKMHRTSPTCDTFFTVEEALGAEGSVMLNLFTGLAYSRQRVRQEMEGMESQVESHRREVETYLRYLRDIVCGGSTERYNYLQRWIYQVLVLKKKPESAIVLLGEQGTGKSTLGKLLGKIIGTNAFLVFSKASAVTGEFNDHLQGKLLGMSEEAVHSSDKKGVNVLKDIITSDSMLIHKKFHPQYTVKNNLALIFTGNSIRTIMHERTNRRYAFYNVALSMEPEEAFNYFECVRNIDPLFVAWFYYYDFPEELKQVDLRLDLPRDNNDLHFETALVSAPFHVQFIYEMLTQQFVGFAANASFDDWQNAYVRWSAEKRLRNPYVNTTVFFADLIIHTHWDSQLNRLESLLREEQIKKFKSALTKLTGRSD